jgi:hypothetical protein
MDAIYALFVALHVISFIGALMTLYILSSPTPAPPSSPGASSTTSKTYAPSASQKLLMVSCINSMFMSTTIALPGFGYQFNTSLYPTAICWLQGLFLQLSFIAQHMIMLVLSAHTWLLIVR